MRIFEENGKMVVKPDGISDKWMFIDKSVDPSKTDFLASDLDLPDDTFADLNNLLPRGKSYERSNIIQDYVNELGKEKILDHIPKYALMGFYALLNELAEFVRENPDDDSLILAVEKVYSLCATNSDVRDVYYLENWGTIIRMLALEGLYRWLWAFNIREKDEGYNEYKSFFKWVESLLFVCVASFCLFRPLNPDTARMKDEERALVHTTKQICQYMLRTFVGYNVQCRIRAYVLGDMIGSRDCGPALKMFIDALGTSPLGNYTFNPSDPYYLPQPDFIDNPKYVPSYSFTPYQVDSTDKDEDEKQREKPEELRDTVDTTDNDEDSSERRPKALPKELDNVRFKALLQRLIDEGYCKIEDGKYKWIDDKWDKGRSRTALTCFAYKVSSDFRLNTKECGDGEIFTNWSIIEEFFEYTGKVKGKNQLKQCRDNWKKSVRKKEGDNGKTPFFNPPEINVIDELFEGLPEIA